MALKYTGVYSLVVVLTIFNEKAYLTKNVNLPKGPNSRLIVKSCSNPLLESTSTKQLG